MSHQTDFLAHYRHPVAFFSLATAIPWALWGAAAWISFQPLTLGSQVAVLVFCLIGLLAPLMVTAGFAHRDPELRHDMVRRLTNFRGIRWHWYLTAATLLFASILLATAVSLLFGYPLEQFQVRNALTFGSSIFPVWIALVVAPVVDKLRRFLSWGWLHYVDYALFDSRAVIEISHADKFRPAGAGNIGSEPGTPVTVTNPW